MLFREGKSQRQEVWRIYAVIVLLMYCQECETAEEGIQAEEEFQISCEREFGNLATTTS